jgi:hypothetical protein
MAAVRGNYSTDMLQLHSLKALLFNYFSLFCHCTGLLINFGPSTIIIVRRIADPATLKPPALQGSFTPQGVLFSPISLAGAP